MERILKKGGIIMKKNFTNIKNFCDRNKEAIEASLLTATGLWMIMVFAAMCSGGLTIGAAIIVAPMMAGTGYVIYRAIIHWIAVGKERANRETNEIVTIENR